MSMQRFIGRERHEFANEAIGWRPGGPFDCLGPFAKVENCPIGQTGHRRTAYATGHADTYFSVPAAAQVKGKRVTGFFTIEDGGCVFIPYKRFDSFLQEAFA